MPAFLVILLFVFLFHWLGWWLLAILVGVVIVVGILVSQDSRRVASAPLIAQPKTIRIEIKSMNSGKDRPSTVSARAYSAPGGRHGPTVALIIKEEPLDQILAGIKTWEMRSQHTRKRETIALAKKGTGHIFGIADIIDSRGPLSDETMQATISMHGIDASRLRDPDVVKYRHAWVLANVRRLYHPVAYSHTKGAQSFVTLDEQTIDSVFVAVSKT